MASATTTISKEALERLLDVEKLKYCFECGACTASCPMMELTENYYNPRRLVQKIFLNPESILASDELWLCAWCYRCYEHCPQSLKLPEIFLLIRAMAMEHGFTEPFEKATKRIAESIPLPLVTTLVCFHPERAGLEREKVLDRIEQLLQERTEKGKRKRTKIPEGKVAVIGSGPAGLTVAHELGVKGYKVTIFETLTEMGGMLRKCIPEYRLPKSVLDKEIQHLKELGVETRTGVAVGKDMDFDALWREEFKAVFVGSGAHKSQRLRIEGGDLRGVIHALDFLWEANSGRKVEVGKKVAVIGGGNVAVDAARTALELGAEKVTILYRRSREEMPANPWEVREAEDKGVEIEFLVSPKKVLGEDGKVSAVECIRMQLGEPDESGRRKPIPIEGSEHKKEADTVILAIGEAPEVDFLPKEIEISENGTVWVNPITMETSLQGVFAGGDVATGPATVIEAVLAGKRAAVSIENYLKSLGE